MRSHSGFEIREYLRSDGSSPYREWVEALPVATHARIAARIVRFEAGNLGDSKAVGEGVWEARFMFGPGYRVYFGLRGRRLVVLLMGGDKGSQRRDIARAKAMWREFMETDDET